MCKSNIIFYICWGKFPVESLPPTPTIVHFLSFLLPKRFVNRKGNYSECVLMYVILAF